jgi:hypothetical protein
MYYSPVRHWCYHPFDLHVLGTPPAFVLSQDQTLKLNLFLSLFHNVRDLTHSIRTSLRFS